MYTDQFWISRTNFGVILGPAGPLLVAKIGPVGPIFSPDQIFRDRCSKADLNRTLFEFEVLYSIECEDHGSPTCRLTQHFSPTCRRCSIYH